MVTLTEAQVGFAVLIGAAALAGLSARRRGSAQAPSAVLIWWGLAGVLALVPMLAMAGNLAVLIPSNLVRLSWILAVSIWQVTRQRHVQTL